MKLKNELLLTIETFIFKEIYTVTISDVKSLAKKLEKELRDKGLINKPLRKVTVKKKPCKHKNIKAGMNIDRCLDCGEFL